VWGILITKNEVEGFRGEKMTENVSEQELCCDGAKLVMEHPSREVDMEEIAEILGTHGSALLWDLHTRETLLMTKRTS